MVGEFLYKEDLMEKHLREIIDKAENEEVRQEAQKALDTLLD